MLVAYAQSYGGDAAKVTARGGTVPTDGIFAAARELRAQAPGARVGRYVILDWLGEGGGGVVYGAYDPDLDRRVALKLLKVAEGSSEEASALLREARALARLSHPNVVRVHDAGTFDDQVFLAMELVVGKNLRAWLRDVRPATSDVMRAMVRAGRGLAAAHAAGLVHRDFKPENVLLGDDGRARVADFGLARLESAAHEGGRVVAGTPAYMAPEQKAGGAVDARTDQYAFCLTLEEALAATSRGVSPRVRAILTRGLRAAPEDRYPSMDALLADLTRAPERRLRRLAIGAALALLLLGGAAWGWSRLVTSPAAMCAARADRVTSAWSTRDREDLARAFRATNAADADSVATRVTSALDAYAAAWRGAAKDACEATHVHGEQSTDLLATRDACLDARLEELAALTRELAHADASLVAHAKDAPRTLESLAACAATRELVARGRGAPSHDVLEARKELAEIEARAAVGRGPLVVTRATELAARARSLGDASLLARALYVAGWLEAEAGNLDASVSHLEVAATTADAAGDDRRRVRAWTALLFDAAAQKKPTDAVDFLRAQATSALNRLGDDDADRARLLEATSAVAATRGDVAGAREAKAEAVALWRRAGLDDGSPAGEGAAPGNFP